MLKNFARKIGFTENELKTILFLLFAALFGLTLKFFNYEKSVKENYDYTKEDSLFNNYKSRTLTVDKQEHKKKIEIKKETSDFSKNKSKLNIKFRDRQKININVASVIQLQTLPGIGKKTAEAIIEYRKSNGKFKKIKDLKKIKGIGNKKFDKIKKFIFVN